MLTLLIAINSLALGMWIGLHLARIKATLGNLQVRISQVGHKPKPVEPPKPESKVIDMTDPVTRANYIREELNKGRQPELEDY